MSTKIKEQDLDGLENEDKVWRLNGRNEVEINEEIENKEKRNDFCLTILLLCTILVFYTS